MKVGGGKNCSMVCFAFYCRENVWSTECRAAGRALGGGQKDIDSSGTGDLRRTVRRTEWRKTV